MKRGLLPILIFLLPFSLNAFDLASKVQSFKLANGMRWLLVYRPGLPIFSGIVVVKAGGADEVAGKTGLAHMFEHMAFKGSKDVGVKDFAKELPFLKEIAAVGREMSQESQKEKPDEKKIEGLKAKMLNLNAQASQYRVKNELWETLTRKGAVELNAFTTKDVTAYHASMPGNQFPLWAYLTSEMVFHPVLREFYQERDVVLEERRLRYDNSPHGFMLEALLEEAFPEGPYHLSPIGKAKDVSGLTIEDALQFHERYYVPENIVGVLVGAIPYAQAKAQLEKFFDQVKLKRPPQTKPSSSFAFAGEKRKKISFPAEPFLLMAFHKPNAPQREDYVFDILSAFLCEERTSRFYRQLVLEKKMASSISCSGSFPGSRFENLFVIFASPNKGHSLKDLEEAILEELEGVKKSVEKEELQKVRASVLYDYYWNLEDNLRLAEQLAISEAVLNDWRYVVTYPKVLQTITKEEVRKVAAKYFKMENRVVIYRVRGKRG